MDHECVRFTVDDAGVGQVVLDRSEKLNALNAQMFAALADAC